MAFIQGSVLVDKRNPSDGKTTHLITCSEDGLVIIWDTRNVEKEVLRKNAGETWKPFLTLNVFKQDGTGELGLSRILLKKH